MPKGFEIMRTPEQKEAHKVYRASLRREAKIKEVEDIRDRLVTLNCPVFNLNLWIEQLKHTKEQG